MIPVFQANPFIAARLQDEIRAHMELGCPRRNAQPCILNDRSPIVEPAPEPRSERVNPRQVLRLADAGFTLGEISEIIGKDKASVGRALRKAKAAYGGSS